VLLAEVSGIGADDLASALRALQQAQLSSAAWRRATYSSIRWRSRSPVSPSLATQRAFTRAWPAALEKLRADRLGESGSRIAYHWERCGICFEAAR